MRLNLEIHPQTQWMQVGGNAETIAWKNRQFSDFPYALDVGLERFYTGSTQRLGTPIHYGQEQFAVFAANFVRCVVRWLVEQCPQLPGGWQNPAITKVKEQVQVVDFTSAWMIWQDQGCLLKFTDQSLYTGRSLSVSRQ